MGVLLANWNVSGCLILRSREAPRFSVEFLAAHPEPFSSHTSFNFVVLSSRTPSHEPASNRRPHLGLYSRYLRANHHS